MQNFLRNTVLLIAAALSLTFSGATLIGSVTEFETVTGVSAPFDCTDSFIDTVPEVFTCLSTETAFKFSRTGLAIAASTVLFSLWAIVLILTGYGRRKQEAHS